MKKALFLILALLTLICCACGKTTEEVGHQMTGVNEVDDFIHELEAGHTDAAYLLYQELTPENKTKANTSLKEFLKEIESKYYSGTYDYVTARMLLDGYEPFTSVSERRITTLEAIEKDNQCSILLEQAKSDFDKGYFERAMQNAGGITADSRFYEEAVKLLADSVQGYREKIIAQCDGLMEKEEYSSAFDTISKALEVLANDASLIKKRQDYYDAYVEGLLNEAEKLGKEEKFDEAIAILTSTLVPDSRLSSKEEELTTKRYNKAVETAIAEAKAFAEKNEWENAVLSASRSYYTLKNDVLWEMFNEYNDIWAEELINEALTEAKALADKKDWQGAVNCLKTASSQWFAARLENDISKTLAEYEKKLPKKLGSLYLISGGLDAKTDNYTNQFGDTYDRVYQSHNTTTAAYQKSAKYLLDANYTIFEANVWTTGTDPSKTLVKIYCDGELKYSVSNMTASTHPHKILLDVTGCRELSIYLYCPVKDYHTFLGDPIVYNQ